MNNSDSLLTKIREDEAQREVLKEVDQLIGEWNKLSTLCRKTRLDTVLFSIRALSFRDRPLCLARLVEAKVITGRMARRQVEEYLKEEGKTPAEAKEPTQAQQLIAFASELTLFHDQNKEAFVFQEYEAIPLRSRRIKQYLSHQLYQNKNITPNSDALNQALLTLEGKAVFDCPQKELHCRVASVDGDFYYDLGNGEAIRTTPQGWEIVNPPILFRRYAHQQAQILPLRGGDPWRVFDYLNVSEDHQLLVLVYIISCFIPNIPHPIFHPYGPQGSGKTTLFKIIKELCDPSSIQTLGTSKDATELVQVIAHHHICLFDNLSRVTDWMSDILAQACTGGGFSKRQLYTDDEDLIYRVKRCIGLNSINLLISKPDLMDRSILLHLERIDPSKRIEERQLWEKFEQARPYILGGIFDTLSTAMDIYPYVELSRLPRMADFTRWGYAIAQALERSGEEFLEAYQRNIDVQNEEIIQNNTLAQAVLAFMSDREFWEGTIKEAWTRLRDIVDPTNADPTFPKSERTLKRYLERIKTNLMDMGVVFKAGGRVPKGILIAFQKDRKTSTLSTLSTSDLPKLLKTKVLQDVDNYVDNYVDSALSTLSTSTSTYCKSNNIKKDVDDVDDVDNFHTFWKSVSENFDEPVDNLEEVTI